MDDRDELLSEWQYQFKNLCLEVVEYALEDSQLTLEGVVFDVVEHAVELTSFGCGCCKSLLYIFGCDKSFRHILFEFANTLSRLFDISVRGLKPALMSCMRS